MPEATLPRKARVTAKRDFDRARRDGRVAADAVLRIVFRENGIGSTRLGLAVPRRGSNVERNRIKRVIREVFRARRSKLPEGLDLVVSPKDFERAAQLSAVEQSFESLIARLRAGRAPK
jgi:ribonuclease P protein component